MPVTKKVEIRYLRYIKWHQNPVIFSVDTEMNCWASYRVAREKNRASKQTAPMISERIRLLSVHRSVRQRSIAVLLIPKQPLSLPVFDRPMLLFGGVVVKVVLHLNHNLQALSLTSNTSSKLMSPWHLFSFSDHDIIWYQVSKQIVGYHNTGHGFLFANLGTVNCSEWKVSFESFLWPLLLV